VAPWSSTSGAQRCSHGGDTHTLGKYCCSFGICNPAKLFAAVTEDQLKEFYLLWMERCLELERAVAERTGSCLGALELYDLGLQTCPSDAMISPHRHGWFSFAAGVGMGQLHSKGLALMTRVLGLGQACVV
jgi:hypothetical protein